MSGVQDGFSSFPRATYLFLSLHEEERESGMSNSDFVSPKRNLKGGGSLFVLWAICFEHRCGWQRFFSASSSASSSSFLAFVRRHRRRIARLLLPLFPRYGSTFLGGKARSDVGPLIGMSYFLFFSSSRSSFPPREGKSFGGRAGAVNSLLLLLLLLRTPGVFMFDRYAVQLVGWRGGFFWGEGSSNLLPRSEATPVAVARDDEDGEGAGKEGRGSRNDPTHSSSSSCGNGCSLLFCFLTMPPIPHASLQARPTQISSSSPDPSPFLADSLASSPPPPPPLSDPGLLQAQEGGSECPW